MLSTDQKSIFSFDMLLFNSVQKSYHFQKIRIHKFKNLVWDTLIKVLSITPGKQVSGRRHCSDFSKANCLNYMVQAVFRNIEKKMVYSIWPFAFWGKFYSSGSWISLPKKIHFTPLILMIINTSILSAVTK